MQWKDLKSEVLRLSNEEKVMGVSTLVLLLSCFLPWYKGIQALDGKYEYVNNSAFGSYAFIIGYCIFAFALVAFSIQAAKVLKVKLPKLPTSPEKLLILIGAESIFLITIALFIYTKQSMEYSEAGVKFGLYLGLISSSALTLFGYVYKQKLHQEVAKRKAQEVFQHNYKSSVNLQPETHEEPELKPLTNNTKDIYRKAVSSVQNEVNQKANLSAELESEKIAPLEDQLTIDDMVR